MGNMKIAIISDTHDNLANLENFLLIAKREKIEGIIHCGDVTTPETLDWLVGKFKGEIKVVCGNADIRREEFFALAENYKNLEVFPEIGRWEVGGLKLAFVHQTKPELDCGHYNFVFHGHTHKPWIGQIEETLVANPGTLGGVFTPPTFTILDTETGKLELRRLF